MQPGVCIRRYSTFDIGQSRLYLPKRVLTLSNCGSFGTEDYCELGSRFKAAHIRVMVWWVAFKVRQLTNNTAPQFGTLYNCIMYFMPVYRLGKPQSPWPRVRQVSSQEDQVLRLLAACSYSLAQAQDLMDSAGLILSPHEAAVACLHCDLS